MSARLLTLAVLPVLLAASSCAAQTTRSLLVTDVTLIDGTGRAPVAHRDLVIVDGRIVAVGATGTLQVPRNAERIDGRNRFVIPGLIDSHVHLATYEREPSMQDALLRNALLGGVTTVRDMGGNIAELQAIAGRSRAANAALPRFYFSAIMSGRGSMWFTVDRSAYFAAGAAVGASPGVRQIDSTTDVRRVVAAARATGATGLKLYQNLTPAQISALAAEGRRQGMQVWSHLAMWPGHPSDIVNGGADAVSHANMFMREVLDEPGLTAGEDARLAADEAYRTLTPEHPKIASLIASMRQRRTALDATLGIMYGAANDTLSATTDSARASRRTRGMRVFNFAVAMTRAAHRAGVPIVAGTDNIGRQSPNIHVELQHLVDAVGMTPVEALHAATQAAARVLGIEDSVGTLARGKVADLVLLERDPARDIANTMTVQLVVRGGIVHRRTAPMALPPHARTARDP
jgi:imidazolonepropionase-like amidohydrolase